MPRGGANRGQGNKKYKPSRTEKTIRIDNEFIPKIEQEAIETARSQADIVNQALKDYYYGDNMKLLFECNKLREGWQETEDHLYQQALKAIKSELGFNDNELEHYYELITETGFNAIDQGYDYAKDKYPTVAKFKLLNRNFKIQLRKGSHSSEECRWEFYAETIL